MHIKKHLSFSGLKKQLADRISQIEDYRDKSKVEYSLYDIFMSGFAMMYFQDPSLLQFQQRMEDEIHRNNLKTIFNVEKIPKQTQMRDVADEISFKELEPVFGDWFMSLQRGKHLEQYQFFPVNKVKENNMKYILVAKPDDHKCLMEFIEGIKKIKGMSRYEFKDIRGRKHIYEWINKVPLNGNEDSIDVNYFEYWLEDKGKVTYHNSWVTDININEKNVEWMVKGGRCRWKIENETFNTLKNQGYHIEHNFGHGRKNLSMNFFLLNLLAFFMHQIFELTCLIYQKARAKFSSRMEYWNQLRCTLRILIFNNWEDLLYKIIGHPMS